MSSESSTSEQARQKHYWKRLGSRQQPKSGEMDPSQFVTYYICIICDRRFKHHYKMIDNLYEAIESEGLSKWCGGLRHQSRSKPGEPARVKFSIMNKSCEPIIINETFSDVLLVTQMVKHQGETPLQQIQQITQNSCGDLQPIDISGSSEPQTQFGATLCNTDVLKVLQSFTKTYEISYCAPLRFMFTEFRLRSDVTKRFWTVHAANTWNWQHDHLVSGWISNNVKNICTMVYHTEPKSLNYPTDVDNSLTFICLPRTTMGLPDGFKQLTSGILASNHSTNYKVVEMSESSNSILSVEFEFNK